MPNCTGALATTSARRCADIIGTARLLRKCVRPAVVVRYAVGRREAQQPGWAEATAGQPDGGELPTDDGLADRGKRGRRAGLAEAKPAAGEIESLQRLEVDPPDAHAASHHGLCP